MILVDSTSLLPPPRTLVPPTPNPRSLGPLIPSRSSRPPRDLLHATTDLFPSPDPCPLPRINPNLLTLLTDRCRCSLALAKRASPAGFLRVAPNLRLVVHLCTTTEFHRRNSVPPTRWGHSSLVSPSISASSLVSPPAPLALLADRRRHRSPPSDNTVARLNVSSAPPPISASSIASPRLDLIRRKVGLNGWRG